jgi:hypothetical protein
MNRRYGEELAFRWRDGCESLGLYARVDFFAVHAHVSGRREAKAQLVTPNAKNRNGDLISNLH